MSGFHVGRIHEQKVPAMAKTIRLSLVIAAAALWAVSGPSAAQEWPIKSVRLVVPSPPGDGSDTAARVIGQKLETAFGQPFVVENITGAGGVLATQAVAKSAADGYTLIMGNAGSNGINAAVYSKLSFDPVEDFSPISMVYRAPNIFVASQSLGVKTLADLITLAKTRATKLNYASGGNGSSGHLSTEYLKLLAKFDAVHVPYRGASLALNDILANQIDFMAVNLPPAAQLVQTGKIVGLAVTSFKRSSLLAHIATVAESGFPEYETIAWFGLLAPKGTSQDIIRKLHLQIGTACRAPDVIEKLAALGGEMVCNTPAEFGANIRADVARWRKVVTEASIRVN